MKQNLLYCNQIPRHLLLLIAGCGFAIFQHESQLNKITRDSAKITVEQVHGLMSQVIIMFCLCTFGNSLFTSTKDQHFLDMEQISFSLDWSVPCLSHSSRWSRIFYSTLFGNLIGPKQTLLVLKQWLKPEPLTQQKNSLIFGPHVHSLLV